MDVLAALCAKLDADLDQHGRAHADCPFCGAPARTRGRAKAYHFYVYDLPRGSGYICWSCNARGSLGQLAQQLSIVGVIAPPVRTAPQTPPAPFCGATALQQWSDITRRRIEAVRASWQAYKPVSDATIVRWSLSLGRVPILTEQGQWTGSRHERLLVPLMAEGRIVGIVGRTIRPDDDGPKWLTASTSDLSHLFGLDHVQADQDVIICENRVDAILAMQEAADVAAVAIGGAHWRQEWTAQIAAKRPAQVVVWLDHDLAGNGSRYHAVEMLTEWRRRIADRRALMPELAARPFPQPPTPRGPAITNALLSAGVPARLYEWPRGTPRGADLGWALMQERS